MRGGIAHIAPHGAASGLNTVQPAHYAPQGIHGRADQAWVDRWWPLSSRKHRQTENAPALRRAFDTARPC